MHAILGTKKNLELVTFRYSKIDPQVNAFKKSDKSREISDYKLFNKTLNTIFK